ncbi:hypothetical protein U1Q18_036174 [Sarracenia purpurea var. burkii]
MKEKEKESQEEEALKKKKENEKESQEVEALKKMKGKEKESKEEEVLKKDKGKMEESKVEEALRLKVLAEQAFEANMVRLKEDENKAKKSRYNKERYEADKKNKRFSKREMNKILDEL